jgi:hypothetical protein
LHNLLIDKKVDDNEPTKSKKTAETAENGKEAKRQSPQSRHPESEGEINHNPVGKNERRDIKRLGPGWMLSEKVPKVSHLSSTILKQIVLRERKDSQKEKVKTFTEREVATIEGGKH